MRKSSEQIFGMMISFSYYYNYGKTLIMSIMKVDYFCLYGYPHT